MGPVEGIIDTQWADPDLISRMLVEYGRALYTAGKPYGTFSETINAVTSRRGALRRQLGPASDLAFSWVADEPSSHRPAMPRSILLAISSLATLWAWPVEAGIFLLTWVCSTWQYRVQSRTEQYFVAWINTF